MQYRWQDFGSAFLVTHKLSRLSNQAIRLISSNYHFFLFHSHTPRRSRK